MTQTKTNPKVSEDYIEYVVTRAHMAGLKAGEEIVPKVFNIVDGENKVLDTLEDGLCGFAWVTIRPNRGPLVAYLKKQGVGDAGHAGGFVVWINRYNQSQTRKYAYAKAFAEVLNLYGFNAVAGTRLD